MKSKGFEEFRDSQGFVRTIQDTEAWQELPKQKEQTLGCINNCRSLGTCNLSFLSQVKLDWFFHRF